MNAVTRRGVVPVPVHNAVNGSELVPDAGCEICKTGSSEMVGTSVRSAVCAFVFLPF